MKLKDAMTSINPKEKAKELFSDAEKKEDAESDNKLNVIEIELEDIANGVR